VKTKPETAKKNAQKNTKTEDFEDADEDESKEKKADYAKTERDSSKVSCSHRSLPVLFKLTITLITFK